MFEIEKFVTVKSDKEMEKELEESQAQLKKVKELKEAFEVYKANIVTDEEKLFKLSPNAASMLCYFKTPADLIVFTIFYSSHDAAPNVLADIMGSLLKDETVHNDEERVKKWGEIVIDLIREHPVKEDAIKRLDYLAETLLAPK